MCGRFTLRASPQSLQQEFDLFSWPETSPRFNIAPTQLVPIVRMGPNSKREAVLMRWGLIPSWAEDPKIGNRMINARADTVAVKPAFRSAFKQRRCLVPSDGFYEWQQGSTPKQPYHIHLASGQPFAMAGLWEHWHHDGHEINSFTIVTTDANDELRLLHDRMPVILRRDDYAVWLSPVPGKSTEVTSLLKPYAGQLVVDPVDRRVNSPAHDDEQCLAKPPSS